jgi:hypothetical protein
MNDIVEGLKVLNDWAAIAAGYLVFFVLALPFLAIIVWHLNRVGEKAEKFLANTTPEQLAAIATVAVVGNIAANAAGRELKKLSSRD